MLALVMFVAPGSAEARIGHLDPTFGQRGRAFTSLDTAEKGGEVELVSAPDGSAVLAADGGDLVRFDADGSRDTSFGEEGELFLGEDTAGEGVAELSFLPSDIAADSRGRLLVFGRQTDTRESYDPYLIGVGPVPASSALVLRFTAEGKPDLSFGGGRGFIRADFGLGSELRTNIPMVGALAGRTDSKDRPVFVAGVSSVTSGCYGHAGVDSFPRAVVRLTESGQIDRLFGGGDGLSPVEGSTDFPGLGIDRADRPIVSVGPTGGKRPECRFGTTVIRLRQNGARMSSFGADGARAFKRLDLGVVQPSGAMILSYSDGRTVDLARIRPDGSRDMSFGEDGLARVTMPSRVGAHLRPVAVDGQGRILLAGFIGSPVATPAKAQPRHSAFIVSRLLPNGKLDMSFGNHGRILTWFAPPLELNSAKAILDPKGGLLVAGTVTAPGRAGGYVLVRYLLGS